MRRDDGRNTSLIHLNDGIEILMPSLVPSTMFTSLDCLESLESLESLEGGLYSLDSSGLVWTSLEYSGVFITT